jgi:ribosomal protein S18 acetylase RimI-like enzyme
MTPEKMSQLHSKSEANHRIWHAHEFSELLSLPGVITELHAHGFALARVVDTEAELLLIVTENIKQNTGLATSCLLKIEKKLIHHGAQKLTLEVSESNSAAITVYTKLNYKKIAIRKSYSRDKNGKFETALVMQKDLHSN